MGGDRSNQPVLKLPPLPDAPSVAVVIPALHAASSLEATVVSAIAQSPHVDEVVIAVGDPATSEVAHRLAEASAREASARDASTRDAPTRDASTRDAPTRDASGREASASDAEPVITVVGNPSRGTSAGLNAAIAATDAEILVRLDAHARLPDGYVERAVTKLAETGAANVGGKQVPEATGGFARAVACAMRSKAGAGGAAYRTGAAEGPVDTVYLGVFRRDALDHVGGFDERFVRNQDAELNERLRAHGYVVWLDPALAVAYEPRGNVASLARQYFAYGRWRRATVRRHPGSMRARQAAAPVLVIGLGAFAIAAGVLRQPWLAALPAAAYAVGLVIAGWHATRSPLRAVPTAAALATMHLTWGLGFLIGPGRAFRHARVNSTSH